MNAYSLIRRNPNFFLVWIGQILSQSGARVYQMAIIWWILGHATDNAGAWVGSFMVATALPGILLLKLIGKCIDKNQSKFVLVRADFISSVLVLGVSYLLYEELLTLPVALLIGFLGASLQAFIDPTLNKALAEVVAKEDFDNGLSLLTSTQSLANFAGAVLGALLIDRLGFGGTALLASMGYLISSVASKCAEFTPVAGSQALEEKAGWEILNGEPLIKRMLIGFGMVNFFATPTLVVLPVYTKRVLEGSASLLGSLEAALWVGLLAGALLSGFIFPKSNRLLAAVFCIGLFGVFLGVPGFVVNPYIYMVALALAGLFLGVNNVKIMGFFQEKVPSEIKGRFFALMQGVISFTFPIAYFFFGVLTDTISVQTVCLIQSIGVVLLAFYFVPLINRSST